MQDKLNPMDFYAPITELINTIYPATTNSAKKTLKTLLSYVTSLSIAYTVTEKDYRFFKNLIEDELKQFKAYHKITNSFILEKEIISNATTDLYQQIDELLKVCDERYIRKYPIHPTI